MSGASGLRKHTHLSDGDGGTIASYTAGGTDVPVADGGTGASTASSARTNLGISATNTPITDTGNYYTGTEVESALQEVGASVASLVAGGAGVTVKDEGSTLATLGTTFDFVGSGVTASGTGATKTVTIPGGSGWLPPATAMVYEECHYPPTTGLPSATAILNGGTQLDVSGSGAGVTTGALSVGHPGVIRLTTGTTSGGRCGIKGGTAIAFGSSGAALESGAILAIPTISDGSQRFYVWAGVLSSASSESAAIGVYFRVTDNVNSGNWEAVAINGGSSTVVDTGVAPVAATFTKLVIIVNANATSATYYIDGSLVATITTNLPSTTTSYLPANIVKSVGSTARTIDLDAYWYIWTTSR